MDYCKKALKVDITTEVLPHRWDSRAYIYESSACYGMGKILKGMAFLPAFLPLVVETDHGPSQRDEPTKREYLTTAPIIYYHSRRLVEIWKKNSLKLVSHIYSPFAFYRNKKIERVESVNKKGTIAFPAHSTDLIDADFKLLNYIEQLKALPAEFHPIDICIYYRDIEKGRHKVFIENGFDVYCAGHIYNEKFVENFYTILLNYQYSTSNTIGSYTFYSVESGVPFFVYGEKTKYDNILNDPNCVQGVYDPYALYKQMVKGYNLFIQNVNSPITITQEQKQFVIDELGLKNFNRLNFILTTYKHSLGYCMKKYVSDIYSNIKLAQTQLSKRLFRKKYRYELSIFTHLTFDEKYLLYRLAKKMPKDSVCVEIGSFLGASSCFIAAGISNLSKIYCIDTWGNHAMKYVESDTDAEERDTYEEFVSNTKMYKSKITPLRGWSYDMIHELKENEGKIDFLFIDGDHNYEGVKKDWDLYSQLLKSNSVVVFHDIGWAEGVKKVVKEEVKPIAKKDGTLPNMYFAIIR